MPRLLCCRVPFITRFATARDAIVIAHVQTQSWRETYAGLMPPTFLARMTDEAARARRERMWADVIPDTAQITLVAEHRGAVVGFMNGGPPRDHPGFEAELNALYLLQSAQGSGIGRTLILALARALQARGSSSMALWVLDGNPTRGFYERLGGVVTGEKVQSIEGSELREIRYGWPDLGALSG